MPTIPYKNAAGKRLPGTTTVAGRFKEADALIHWAWNLGMEGADYRKVRQSAADVGTVAHEYVDAHINNREPNVSLYPAAIRNKAQVAFKNFLSWELSHKLQVVETEVHLVSEEWQYGGTPDAIAVVDGKLSLLDWKTSARIYPETLIQIAAYKHLWEENRPGAENEIVGGCHVVRFNKEDAGFQHVWFDDLSEEWKAFMHMRELYELMKGVKRRAG